MSVAMIINKQEITQRILLEEWDSIKKKLSDQGDFLEEYPQQEQMTLALAKDNIVKRVLLEQEANKLIPEIPFNDTKEHYQKIIQHFGDNESFEKKFNASTEQEKKKLHQTTKENVESSLKVEKLIKSWLEENPDLEEEDFEKFYQENKDEYQAKERVIFSYLILDIDKASQSEKEIFLEICQTSKHWEEALERLKVKKVNEHAVTGNRNVIIEFGAKIDIKGFKNINEPFTLKENTCSPVYERTQHLLWLEKKQHLAPGPWSYEHVMKRVKKDALSTQKNFILHKKISSIRKNSEIKDCFNGQ